MNLKITGIHDIGVGVFRSSAIIVVPIDCVFPKRSFYFPQQRTDLGHILGLGIPGIVVQEVPKKDNDIGLFVLEGSKCLPEIFCLVVLSKMGICKNGDAKTLRFYC